MAWRTLATTQQQQLAERDTTIDILNQRLSASNQQVAALQFQLAEQAEGLVTSRTSSDSHESDRLSKLLLEHDVLKAKHDQLSKRAEAAEADLKAAVTLCSQREVSLRDRPNPSPAQVNTTEALEQAVAQAKSETTQARTLADDLREQLRVARREHASQRWRERCPDGDQDDEELAPPSHKPTPMCKQSLMGSAYPSLKEMQPLPKSLKIIVTNSGAPDATALRSTARTQRDHQCLAGATISRSRRSTIPRRKRKRGVRDDRYTVAQELRRLHMKGYQPPDGKRRRSEKSLALDAIFEDDSSEDDSGEDDSGEDDGDEDEDGEGESGEDDGGEVGNGENDGGEVENSEGDNGEDNGDEDEGGEEDEPSRYKFTAVTSWRADGLPGDSYTSGELREGFKELWEKIEVMWDVWDEVPGKRWHDKFPNKGEKLCVAQCMTKTLCGGQGMQLPDGGKLPGGHTLWRTDCEGKMACEDCVAKGWPCFTWYEGNGGELLLLPLHEQDRRRKVKAGHENRHWVNS
ncbi:hypothetical protein LTR35_012342 [Friedmanniomyces endolithicus]|uniref:Uncharacterized protein n=1 Tax=Friedmanniomyces endolithicus TaxID=329885 RepID=A0AAN6FBL4_9PEZI|nr:hypothetical protein LTR35_012342 [Friedmanniomyces endolithicus]KAK0281411.1 hypothetical protein LTS00_012620 [Friedmanniomyces endolithicus]KAK0313376.1 hypothetical protein LTR82_013407 [Friedmanniomyces endolithicus]KAK1015223.1 hypothetical protein LTR54_003766 [Friedmanniomyces endolithicus]